MRPPRPPGRRRTRPSGARAAVCPLPASACARARQNRLAQPRLRHHCPQLHRHRRIVRLFPRGPRAQRRIALRLRQRLRPRRILRIAPARAIRAQEKFRLIVAQACFLRAAAWNATTLLSPSAASRCSAARNGAFPRDSRDITGPIGPPSASAIASTDRSSRSKRVRGARHGSSTDWSATTTVAASTFAPRSISSAAIPCSPGGKFSIDVARASRYRPRKNYRSSVANNHDFAFVASPSASPFVARI